MTDRGKIALARAIDARGLPKVQELEMEIWEEENYTALGFGALALAFVKDCPEMGNERFKVGVP